MENHVYVLLCLYTDVATLGRQLGYPGLLGRHFGWINRINLCRELYSISLGEFYYLYCHSCVTVRFAGGPASCIVTTAYL